jgi:hypothetical protein
MWWHSSTHVRNSADVKFLVTSILLVCLLVAVAIAWGNFNGNEDLLMALCAGRDALEGRLGQPDQWSFATNGRIWVNQGWLSGFFFYLSYLYLQELGPVLIKGLVLVASLALIFFKCRRLGVSQDIALVAMTLGTMSMGPVYTIRAETFAVLYFVSLTFFLTAPASMGIARQLGTFAVMLIWWNSHGSFLIGFTLIGVKVAVQVTRVAIGVFLDSGKGAVESPAMFPTGISGGDGVVAKSKWRQLRAWGECLLDGDSRAVRRDAILWALTLVACLLGAAFVNPFGPANLQMPFQQTESSLWTARFRFWQPLVRLRGFSAPVLYDSYRSIPILLFLLLFFLLALCAMVVARRRWPGGVRPLSLSQVGGVREDLLTETATVLVIVAMTFRWGRLTVVTGLIMVPLVAFLMQYLLRAIAAHRRAISGRWVAPVLSAGLLVFLTWAFLERTVPPYLPQNPVFPDCSPIKRIHGMYWDRLDLPQFLKENRITGNVYCIYPMSDFLLLHAPDIKIWVDVRTQSIYSETDWREYGLMENVDARNPESVKRALALLDRHNVTVAVLENGSPLVGTMLETSRWLPVYMSRSGIIFLRSDSERGKDLLSSEKVDGLKFPDDRTKVMSQALLWLAKEKRIPPAIESGLKSAAIDIPLPQIYGALFLSHKSANGCLDGAGRDYLYQELKRLAGENFMRADGLNTVLKSMQQIIFLLEYDTELCPGVRPRMDFNDLKKMLRKQVNIIQKEYLPMW